MSLGEKRPPNDKDACKIKMPKKGQFRQRAHANPFSDHDLIYPLNPSSVDWAAVLYSPELAAQKKVEILDIGCGYGGLLIALSPLFPNSLILGFEIRQKVVEYVRQRILALRAAGDGYQNIAVERTNSMKYLVNYISKGQIAKVFILFPDPHFKKKKHKARIITSNLLAEYAFVLKPGGHLYIATDVPELYDWMINCLEKFPLFSRLAEAEACADPCVEIMLNRTEESFKVVREGREKYYAVYRRIDNPN